MSKPDPILAAFTTPPPKASNGSRCRVGVILNTLTVDARTAVETALHPDSGWQSSQIARRLTDLGHQVKASSVSRHRRALKGAEGCDCVS